MSEYPLIFNCENETLLGILHEADSELGVLIVVGGPQYRVGSHRQFVLLARQLAQHGISTLRFDVRGMGDASGAVRDFSDIGAYIGAAIQHWLQRSPHLKRLVVWGLCDAASAICEYACQDPRISGIVLLNPWVYTEQSNAKTYLKHYYWQRLLNGDFWRKLLALKFDARQSCRDFKALLQKSRNRTSQSASTVSALSLPQRMARGLRQFDRPICVILSGRDLVADEFRELIASDPRWRQLMLRSNLTQYQLNDADHTFSKAEWRNQVADWTMQWINTL
jgi:uncharacterized protein